MKWEDNGSLDYCLVSSRGEILDRVQHRYNGDFVVESTGKRYTSSRYAKAAVDAVLNHFEDKPFEMRLCEVRFVTPRPNRPYIFTVDPECPKCMLMAAPYAKETK